MNYELFLRVLPVLIAFPHMQPCSPCWFTHSNARPANLRAAGLTSLFRDRMGISTARPKCHQKEPRRQMEERYSPSRQREKLPCYLLSPPARVRLPQRQSARISYRGAGSKAVRHSHLRRCRRCMATVGRSALSVQSGWNWFRDTAQLPFGDQLQEE
jgi:hypothetical protein